jgi:hypothetical protein
MGFPEDSRARIQNDDVLKPKAGLNVERKDMIDKEASHHSHVKCKMETFIMCCTGQHRSEKVANIISKGA